MSLQKRVRPIFQRIIRWRAFHSQTSYTSIFNFRLLPPNKMIPRFSFLKIVFLLEADRLHIQSCSPQSLYEDKCFYFSSSSFSVTVYKVRGFRRQATKCNKSVEINQDASSKKNNLLIDCYIYQKLFVSLWKSRKACGGLMWYAIVPPISMRAHFQ